MTVESKLPAAQQARRDRIAAEEAAANVNITTGVVTEGDAVVLPSTPASANIGAPQPSAPDPNTVVTTTVQISQEELNKLRAEAEQATVAKGRASVLEMDLAEAQAALTAAQQGSKATGVGDAPAPTPGDSAPVAPLRIEFGSAELTEEEKAEYGEAEPIIVKLVKRELAGLNRIFEEVEKRLVKLEAGYTTVSQASEGFEKHKKQEFVNRVKTAVKNFEEVISHKHWQDFQKASFPGTGQTYAQALANAHYSENLEDMKYIFDTFTSKYITVPGSVSEQPNYSGIDTGSANPSGTVVSTPKEKMKISDRRKASEDYLKGRITQAELDTVKKAFAQADAEGRVDYDN